MTCVSAQVIVSTCNCVRDSILARSQNLVEPDVSESNTGQLRALDLFPDLSDEIDRRITHSETRIKYWVLVGVVVNFLIAVGAAIPVIYASGTIASDIRTSL